MVKNSNNNNNKICLLEIRTAPERVMNSYSAPLASAVFLSIFSLHNFLSNEVTAVAFNLSEGCWWRRSGVVLAR